MCSINKGVTYHSLILCAVAASAYSGTAHASADTAAPAGAGEIVVTAQKREQNVQKVGIAITALGKETLAAIGRQDVTALAGQVPDLAVNQYSPTITVFNIRGISQNDFTDAQEAPIAFYEDEVYVASLGAITGMNFDLERVEVVGDGVDIDEHRAGAGQHDRLCGRKECVRNSDNFVARPYPQRPQNNDQRRGSIANANAMRCTYVTGELTFQALHVIAEEETHPL